MKTAEPRIPDRPSPVDLVFLLRPMILIPVWTFFLLGARHGSRAADTPPGSALLLLGAACFTAVAGSAYIVNQISDRDTDRVSGKLFLLSHGIIKPRSAWVMALLLFLLSTAAAALFLPRAFLVIALLGSMLGWGYSMEPFRLKGRPALDVLANAAANGVLNTLAGWAAVGAPMEGVAVLAPYPLAVASVHLSTTLADIEGDRAAGLRTSGAALGRAAGLAVSAALMAGSLALAVIAGNTPALAAAAVSLASFAAIPAAERLGRPAPVLLPAKVSTLAYSTAAGVFFPPYFAVLAAVILLTRIYYSRRFGIRYPAL